MSPRKPFIVGIGGTTRPGSSSEQALAFALAHGRTLGAETKLYGGKDLALPMYAPDPAGMTYHGGVSGLVKNAIDYTEEMRADARVYFDGRAVGSIGCGYGYQGPGMVVSQLRQIGHALRGWNVPLAVAINSAVVKFADGSCSEPAIAKQIEIMAAQVVDHARRFMD